MPLGVRAFRHQFEYSRLIGNIVAFSGHGADASTILQIDYLVPDDPRAVDAFSCRILRGDKTLFVSHYLASIGKNDTLLANTHRDQTSTFLTSAMSVLAGLSNFPELQSAMDGGPLVEVPFDYGNYR